MGVITAEYGDAVAGGYLPDGDSPDTVRYRSPGL